MALNMWVALAIERCCRKQQFSGGGGSRPTTLDEDYGVWWLLLSLDTDDTLDDDCCDVELNPIFVCLDLHFTSFKIINPPPHTPCIADTDNKCPYSWTTMKTWLGIGMRSMQRQR